MERKTRVYISGPITKDKGYYRKFLNAEIFLKKMGYEVVNPARLGKLLPKSFDNQDYLDVEEVILKKCDVICMLKNWEDSAGATQEYFWAKECGLRILYEKDVKKVGRKENVCTANN